MTLLQVPYLQQLGRMACWGEFVVGQMAVRLAPLPAYKRLVFGIGRSTALYIPRPSRNIFNSEPSLPISSSETAWQRGRSGAEPLSGAEAPEKIAISPPYYSFSSESDTPI